MAEQQEKAAQIEFNIQRIFVKDISYECPNSPTIIKKESAPEV